MMQTATMNPVQPWWRIGMVWVAFGGPVLVVLASFVTLFFAIHGRDLPLDEPATRTQATLPDATHGPAVLARNHAATPRP